MKMPNKRFQILIFYVGRDLNESKVPNKYPSKNH